MRQQELRVVDEPLEPFFLQVARRQIAQQHRDLPVLNELVGETGIAARNLFGDQRERLHFAGAVKLDAAEFFRHAKRADAHFFRALQDFPR